MTLFEPLFDHSGSGSLRLRELATEYARLQHLDGFDLASRGRRFNWWLAEMLSAWGHRARAETRENGNIDVAFAIRDSRFILEAKWERAATSIDPIAKLQKRVAQRLGGTIGVFVSMSGYTQDALHDLKDGQRLEVILLTKEHVDAMVSGFCPPAELFELMLDHAHFHGVPSRRLVNLLADEQHKELPRIGQLATEEPPAVSAREGVTATWLARDLTQGQQGLSVSAEGQLYAVTGLGILRINPASDSLEWLKAPTYATDVKALAEGRVAIVRRFGVALLDDACLQVIGGPFWGAPRFAIDCFDTDGITVWSYSSYNDDSSRPICGMLSHLGESLGEVRTVEFEQVGHGEAGAAALLAPDTVLVLGSTNLLVSKGRATAATIDLSNPFSAASFGDGLLIAGNETTLLMTDKLVRPVGEQVQINMPGGIATIATQSGSPSIVYVMAGDPDSNSMSIARLEVPSEAMPSGLAPVAREGEASP